MPALPVADTGRGCAAFELLDEHDALFAGLDAGRVCAGAAPLLDEVGALLLATAELLGALVEVVAELLGALLLATTELLGALLAIGAELPCGVSSTCA